MPAGKTYTPLARTTLTSSAATVTFSSISGSYTDLILVINGNTSTGLASKLRFNSDTGTNYSDTILEGNGTTASSYRETSQTSIWSGSFYNTSNPTTAIINIQNYSNSTTYKTAVCRHNYASGYVSAVVGLWRNTAAINTIDITTGGSNTFLAGSTFTLYGILAA